LFEVLHTIAVNVGVAVPRPFPYPFEFPLAFTIDFSTCVFAPQMGWQIYILRIFIFIHVAGCYDLCPRGHAHRFGFPSDTFFIIFLSFATTQTYLLPLIKNAICQCDCPRTPAGK